MVTRGEARNPDARFWRSRRVLLTGHTGFKGSWLACWLSQLGAEVHGLALEPPTEPNLFDLARVGTSLASDSRVDLRDAGAVTQCVARIKPEIVLHLAAQSLVRRSYAEPAATFATNVIGTVNLLEAARRTPAKAVLVVTSDKCYQDSGAKTPYRESDPLGGHDPYSASKACQELVAASWRASFDGGGVPRIATARAGNVIGAGDWAIDRLVPDCIRAFVRAEPVTLRNPHAVRPWQHVLEALGGYLLLGERLLAGERQLASAWNFGPADDDTQPVGWIAKRMLERWGRSSDWQPMGGAHPHEAHLLKLDTAKARTELGWKPALDLDAALGYVVDWHKAVGTGADARAVTIDQIRNYAASADFRNN